jgi:hypothetical protein
MHYLDSLLVYSAAPTCFDVYTPSSGSLHKRFSVTQQDTKKLPEDDVYTSKHVGAEE